MAQTVILHLLERLKEIGIKDIFGVPGDYAFPVNDAICNDSDLKWIGCCNELNAAYAADGYARIKGKSALCTTYGVGELSAINGIAGSYAENLPVFHIVGMPKCSLLRNGNLIHHSLGNGEFDLFHKMVQPVVCASTILTPENTVGEVERIINAALTRKQPVYIAIPADYALMELGCTRPHKQISLQSDKDTLQTVQKLILEKLNSVKTATVMVGALIGRYELHEPMRSFIEKSGLPFTSMFMAKGTLSETHPNFIGVYNGGILDKDVQEVVETSDLVISFGAIRSDINTGANTVTIDPQKEIKIHPDRVCIGHAVYHNVQLEDVLMGLCERVQNLGIKVPIGPQGLGEPVGVQDAEITPNSLYPRIENFIAEGDIIMAETGTASMGLVNAKLPDKAVFFNQTLWGSIGWATPASFGAAMAAPERRVLLITGEGSHQMTVQEISQFARHGLKPVIICLNNDGYLIERMLCEDPFIYYNDLAQWNYSRLPDALGMTGWFSAKVMNNAELDDALAKAKAAESGAYIEVVTGKMAASEMALALNRIVFKGKGWQS
ncbi:alpha-keto acid decarboxylase family protein [Maridesulfovibrio zosterae]|uniref:alpha-keto acid decarboxylase family protein n=1 Tax=Maridesulfovibrio zosterae TaxID=82171 RepID=UPI000411F241|nr:thiamine pyrophosphate-binding protein [Maridesulfovibrio zosterae]